MLRLVWLLRISCGFFGSEADRRASATSFILDELDAIVQQVPSRGRHPNSRLLAGTVGLNHLTDTAQIAMLRCCEHALADGLLCKFGSLVAPTEHLLTR